jgi:hypothetical protein
MIWWQILIGLIVAWIIYLKIKKFFANIKAMGQRMTIDYFDQNYNFETIFPKKASIVKTIKVGGQKMFVLELDQQFGYKNGDFKEIVIKERHAGHYIGDRKEVHVHVFLPKTDLHKDEYKFDDFDHVVWATVTPID